MKIVSVAEMRSLEAAAIARGVSGYRLMDQAARGAAEIVNAYAGDRRVVILAGKGNNGGDAITMARYLKNLPVIYSLIPPAEYRNEAALAVSDCPVPIIFQPNLSVWDFNDSDIIIDGLLGIGFAGELSGPVRGWIEFVNTLPQPVISLDLPSGVPGDAADFDGLAVEAAMTITFGYPKLGCFGKHSGLLRQVAIEIGESAASVGESYFLADARKHFPQPSFDAHKNSRGIVLVLAGSARYPGAAALAAEAALRAGAGRVHLICEVRPANLPSAVIVNQISFLPQLLELCDAVVAGPGWGKTEDRLPVLSALFAGKKPLVLDADALNLLADRPQIAQWRPNIILTPHGGEAARLNKVFELDKLPVTVVHKGPFTRVGCQNRVSINSSGCVNLATAGAGDVLAGCIGAFLSKMETFEAARLAVFLHGRAGEASTLGMIADDLPKLIQKIIQDANPGLTQS